MPVWLRFAPPATPRVVLLESYLRAIADTGAWGGRWVVALDSDLQAGLARGDRKALATWKSIAAAVAFFERHPAWSSLEPLGVIGVISDFAGPNETTGQEVLNLMGRRSLAYRILESSAAATASLAGFKALIYVDEGAPAPPCCSSPRPKRDVLPISSTPTRLLILGYDSRLSTMIDLSCSPLALARCLTCW